MKLTMKMQWGAPPPHTTPLSFEVKNKIGDVCLRLSFSKDGTLK